MRILDTKTSMKHTTEPKIAPTNPPKASAAMRSIRSMVPTSEDGRNRPSFIKIVFQVSHLLPVPRNH
jgi:hypothetical protein